MTKTSGKWPAFFAPGVLPPAPGYRLPAGFLLCERFRVIRFVAQGGMGSVYEVEDLELRERVAIKTLRPEIVEDPKLLERFRRETQLARRVTHQNVCRIYDLFRHVVDPRSPSSDVVFLVMELLEGETLLERIRGKGPYRTDEALPVARQVVEALEAAHRAAVVHRDFKSANIILAPSPGMPGGVRAVVTDFGVARSLDPDPDPGHPELTEVGEAIGTRDYAAPEQLLGGEVTTAADIYALGVVLYEMVTGHRPYEGDEPTPKRFERPPLAPADLVPGLPARWNSAILRCLARDPSERFGHASEVVLALTGERRSRTARPVAAAAALALAAILLALAARSLRTARTGPSSFAHARQLTSSARLDAWPTFTPDGKSLVYASERTGRFELYLRTLGSEAPEVALTSDGQQNLQPTVAPDGRSVAYTCRARGGIWSVSIEGGAPRLLSDFGSRPAFSRDGTLLAFQSESPPSAVGTDFGTMPPSTIWILSLKEGKLQRLTRPGDPPGGHGSPSFSPDGKWIVFSAFDPESTHLWAVPAGGGRPVSLLGSSPYEFDPAVGPDGALFYGALTADWRYAIRKVAVDWRSARVLGAAEEVSAPGAVIPRHFALSRDGHRLGYAGLSLRSNLAVLPMDRASGVPTGPPRFLTSEAARNSRPAFSPDGSRLLFTKWRPGVKANVFVMPFRGGEAIQLTSDPTEKGVPSWFPAGDRIAFFSSRQEHPAIFEQEARPGAPSRVLVDVGPDIDSPRLSPDGRRVAFNSKRGGGTINVWVADVGGAAPRQVTFDRELAGFPCWSPDGKLLAVQVRRGEDRQVGLVPADGGPLEILTDVPGQSWSDGFSPDGSKIAFAGLRNGIWNLYWVSRATRAVQQLTSQASANTYVRYPNWSPRGDVLVYEQAETLGNVWMLSR